MEITSSEIVIGIFASIISTCGFFITWWMKSIDGRISKVEQTLDEVSTKLVKIESDIANLTNTKVCQTACIEEKNKLLQQIAQLSHRIRYIETTNRMMQGNTFQSRMDRGGHFDEADQ